MSALQQKRAWILGRGPHADAYAVALAQLPDVTLTARDLGNAPASTALEGAPDFAVVCDPRVRIERCLRLLTAGCDLLIESPMAANPADADALAALAEAAGRTLVTGSALGFAPVWRSIAARIATGAIGALHEIEWRIARKPESPPRGFSVMDLLPALETFERLAGPLDAVRLEWPTAAAPGALRLEARHASGTRSCVLLACPDAPVTGPEVICRGDRGELRTGESLSVLRTEEGSEVVGPGVELAAGYTEAVTELLRRRARPFIEDRGSILLRCATDALLHSNAWHPV